MLRYPTYNTRVAITQRTKAEDDKLRKALENADLKKFEKTIRQGFIPAGKKKTKKK